MSSDYYNTFKLNINYWNKYLVPEEFNITYFTTIAFENRRNKVGSFSWE